MGGVEVRGYYNTSSRVENQRDTGDPAGFAPQSHSLDVSALGCSSQPVAYCQRDLVGTPLARCTPSKTHPNT